MTRFKELQRIETAIKHKNATELEWAMGYCRMGIQIATRKDHTKYWHGVEKKVREALADVVEHSD
ncbi:MAG TPA: hypothetical protein VFE61_03575 [Candidatus Sulfotelmatobacter sp.]|jgi:hypothetical protein|nr:hypothetical protein [Candidatus Sulfotelmatobacter sp.]